MSSGYSYLNAKLLSQFSNCLQEPEKETYWKGIAEKIRSAILKEWFNEQTGVVGTGSEACYAFALWLGILPDSVRLEAAKRLHQDLLNRNYQFTTGNLCTRYLLDMLTEYGYVDDAYRLMTSETYPSFGFELQQEATTIWERFEMKENPGMNSHNHPMYGSVGSWFYTGLAGIRPTGPGFSHCMVKPAFPKALLSVQASVDTVRGRLTVRWLKRFGELHLYIDLPPQTVCNLDFAGQQQTLGPGTHHFSIPETQIQKGN
jgi:alpha-L-rhamnosidase